MRRGPGLVRGVARTAVVAGTATAVSGRVARRQQAKFNSQEQQAYEEPQAPPAAAEPMPAPPAPDDTVEQLQQLSALKDQGILTEEEFTAKKKQILGI